jgi:hypothetical protein
MKRDIKMNINPAKANLLKKEGIKVELSAAKITFR